MDYAIHQVNNYMYLVDSAVCVGNSYPLDSVIYPVDSIIQLLYNRDVLSYSISTEN